MRNPVLGLMTAAFLTHAAFAVEPFVAGELIVKLKPGVDKSFFQSKSLGSMTLDREINLSYGTLFVVKVNSQDQLAATQKSLEMMSEVQYAEPNYIWSVGKTEVGNTILTDDPKFDQLWGLHNTGSNEPLTKLQAQGVAGADVDALRAWEITKGDRRVRIAVIDTGIDYTHPDLAANVWVNEAELNGRPGVDDDGNGYVDDIHGYDFANNDGDAKDDHGHGSHCAGTIGALHDNGIGVAGVMSEVTLVPVKFLSASGSGTTEGAIKSIDYAAKMNVDIMSNSWGGGGYSKALEDAIKNAGDKGIVFTAAAGNSGTNNDSSPHYPSSYNLPNIVAVAAHTIGDQLASFSCYGRRTVHVAAPGYHILSTVLKHGYAVYSGTSMATPHVSGVIGLLIAKEGRMSHESLRERVLATSVPVRSYRRKNVSNGRINAYNLLTDTRPERSEPNPTDWQEERLRETFETVHPYANSSKLSKTFTVAGAKYIRLVINRYDVEAGYDFIKVLDGQGNVLEMISGEGQNQQTEYAEGDTITLEFDADYSVNKWGFKIEKLEFIR